MASLIAECRRRGWHRSEQGTPRSNILMNGALGGSLFVPNADYDTAFLPAYARALRVGEPVFVIECRTQPLFRWHADVDVLGERALTDEEVDVLCRALCDALAATFPGARPVLVCAAPPKAHKGMIKTGLHLVCPTIECDAGTALAVRELALEGLARAQLTCANGWEDALDTSVYRGSGLRMVGASKVEPCPCGRDAACGECGGRGKRDGGRAYKLHRVWSTTGVHMDEWLEKLRDNPLLLCNKTSIRCLTSGGALQPPQQRPRESPRDRAPAAQSSESSAIGASLAVLVANCPSRHASLRVASVQRAADCIFLRVDTPGECGNVARCHSTSNVYFVVQRTFVTQRCFCRKHGCPEFRGPALQLTERGVHGLRLSTNPELPPGFVGSAKKQRS